MEDINVETVYEGSRLCPGCGMLMTPLEALYTDGKLCPTCRNLKFKSNVKSGMAG